MDRAALKIYILLLILAPILFGAVHTYAYSILTLGILAASLLLLIQNTKKEDKFQLRIPRAGLNLLFILLIAYLVFQAVPLPQWLVKLLSPEAAVVKQKSFPAALAVDWNGNSKEWYALAPYAYPVIMSLSRIIAYGFFFLGLTQVLNSRKRIELAVLSILVLCSLEALYGIIQAYSGAGYVLWYRRGPHMAVSGTYINRNHFAGLMEMGLLLAASYAAAISVRKRTRKTIPSLKTSFRARISRFLSGEQRLNKRILIIFAGAIMGVGLILSGSRGGIMSAAAGMLAMGLLFMLKSGHRKKGVIVLCLFLLISAYSLYIGIEYPASRFDYFGETFENRTRLTRNTLEMFKDYMITGVGGGSFFYAYPRYQSPEIARKSVGHAHNDWAELMAESGITGLVLFLAGIIYYLYRKLRLWRIRGDSFAVCLGAAPMAVGAAIGFHSLMDFNLHLPANCMTFIAVIAIGYCALRIQSRGGGVETLLRYHIFPLRHKGLFSLFLMLVLISLSGWWMVRNFVAESYCSTESDSTLNRDRNPPLMEIRKAIAWNGLNAEHYFKLARGLIRVRGEKVLNPEWEMKERYQDQMEIIRSLERAVQLNPFSARYHMRLGWEYYYLWRIIAHDDKWLSAADISMDRAAYFAGDKDPGLHTTMGNYWIIRTKTTDPLNPQWHAAWSKACWHYKKAQELDGRRGRANGIMRFVWNYYPDKHFLEGVLLERYHNLMESLK